MRWNLSAGLSRGAAPVAVALASLTFLAAAAPRAQAQPQMVICIVANKTDDEAALERARKYMADAKDKDSPEHKQEQEQADKGLPPQFPNPPAGPSVTATQLAAAAALPQLGLGDSLLSLELLNQPSPDAAASKEKPLPHRYRWVELRERELRLLELSANAFENKTDLYKTDLWKKLAQDREEGKPTIYPDLDWILCSRTTKDKNGVVFFALVREPSPACAVTDAYLENVRLNVDTPPFTLTLTFKEPEGRERLRDMTSADLPPKGKDRYLTIVVRNQAVVIWTADSELKHGRVELKGDFAESEITDTARKLQNLLPRAPGGE